MSEVDLSSLVGQTFELYGVDAGFFCIANAAMGKVVLEAVEDQEDGYRSSLEKLRLVTDPMELAKHVFFERPVAIATAVWHNPGGDAEDPKHPSPEELVAFNDQDGHAWLLVGTDYSDGYYPTYECTWRPKPCPGCLSRGLHLDANAPGEMHADGCLKPLLDAADRAVEDQ